MFSGQSNEGIRLQKHELTSGLPNLFRKVTKEYVRENVRSNFEDN
jgi:hypothetical protein